MRSTELIFYCLFFSVPFVAAIIGYLLLRRRAAHKPDAEKDMVPGTLGQISNIDPLCLYHYIHELVQPNSTLFLLEVDSRYQALLKPHQVDTSRLPYRTGILSDKRGWHLQITDELITLLKTEMNHIPLRGGDPCQLGWVIILYDSQGIYFEWINPPDEPINISLRIPRGAVEHFVSAAKIQAPPIDISPGGMF